MQDHTKPITPEQARANKINVIPSEVIEVINQILIQKINGQQPITILQDALVSSIASRLDVPRQVVFDSHWLDFEDLYRSHWKVTYDKAAYNEIGDSSWTFVPLKWPSVS